MNSDVSQRINNFFQAYPQRTYKKGEIVTYAGANPPGVLYIEKGRIAQYDIANDGRKIVVNIFKSPAFFPMSWAINGTPNLYSYEADSASVVRCAPPEAAVGFLKENPPVTYDLLSRVYSGTDGLLRRLAHVLGGKASTLILFELIICCRRFGEQEKNQSYTLAITDQELASHTGLSRETVNRELQLLKQTGVVTLSYGKIHIPNLGVLEDTLGTRL